MKIGIISMQRVYNYGSFLQAYGLKNIIERLGHTVIFVDYKSKKPIVPYSRKRMIKYKLRCIPFLGKAYDIIHYYVLNQKKFQYKYNLFYLKELGVSYRRNSREIVDIAVIGSDEVFNCLQSGANVGFSPMLFGQNVNAQKIISYAASFGYTTIDGLKKYELTSILKKYFAKFSAISVRDENSKNIIEELTGNMPVINLDPVLISDYDLPSITVPFQNYIVLYTYKSRPYSADEISAIKKFCKNNKKLLISIGDAKSWVEHKVHASPLEMLCYIKNADFVITDTFHGAVFSIKYNKNFAVMVREDNYQKLNDLLVRLNMDSRKITDFSQLQKMFENIPNFEKTNRIIETEKERTYQYLKQNLCL